MFTWLLEVTKSHMCLRKSYIILLNTWRTYCHSSMTHACGYFYAGVECQQSDGESLGSRLTHDSQKLRIHHCMFHVPKQDFICNFKQGATRVHKSSISLGGHKGAQELIITGEGIKYNYGRAGDNWGRGGGKLWLGLGNLNTLHLLYKTLLTSNEFIWWYSRTN